MDGPRRHGRAGRSLLLASGPLQTRMPETLFPTSWPMALEWFGIAIFAVTGALVASRKRMDIFGFILLGAATGIGGGSLRDLMLGQLPVFWVKDQAALAICIAVSAPTTQNSDRPAASHQSSAR